MARFVFSLQNSSNTPSSFAISQNVLFEFIFSSIRLCELLPVIFESISALLSICEANIGSEIDSNNNVIITPTIIFDVFFICLTSIKIYILFFN